MEEKLVLCSLLFPCTSVMKGIVVGAGEEGILKTWIGMFQISSSCAALIGMQEL